MPAHCFYLYQLLSDLDRHAMGSGSIFNCNPELVERHMGIILLFCGHSFDQRFSNPRNHFTGADFKLRVFCDLPVLVCKAGVLEQDAYFDAKSHWVLGG